MTSRLKQILISAAVVLVLLSVCAVLGYLYVSERNKYERQQRNVIALTTEADTLRTRNGQLALDNGVLHLQVAELRDGAVPELQREIENLRLKLRRIESYSQTVVLTTDTLTVERTDTLVIRDTDTVRILHFDYTDEFTHISGYSENDTAISITYATTDSIVQVVYRGKRTKWWRIFQPRPLHQRIYSKNPHANIRYNETIFISK
ncbi:MAG: hypothetical protein IKP45_02970 [Bacteroidales bacterium]|nr:hypothetical protein [Bacteroidales bacterium]